MEKTIITSGKTIELAVEAALAQLGLSRDDITYEVLSLPSPVSWASALSPQRCR